MEFRTYYDSLGVTAEYRKLHDFLVQTGNREFTYARFDWMMTNRDYLEGQYVKRIGLWEEKGKLVAAVLFDHTMDVSVPLTLPGFDFLYPPMVDYAKKHMVKPGQHIAHAGMWYDSNAAFALVEPVCTVPRMRGQGFGVDYVCLH